MSILVEWLGQGVLLEDWADLDKNTGFSICKFIQCICIIIHIQGQPLQVSIYIYISEVPPSAKVKREDFTKGIRQKDDHFIGS